MRLRRITWKGTETPEHRQQCAAWLRGRGGLPLPQMAEGRSVWRVKWGRA